MWGRGKIIYLWVFFFKMVNGTHVYCPADTLKSLRYYQKKSSKENIHNSSETQAKGVVHKIWVTYGVNAESRLTEKLDLIKPQQKTCPGEGYHGSHSFHLSSGESLSSESASTQRSGQEIRGLLLEDQRPIKPLSTTSYSCRNAPQPNPQNVFSTKAKGLPGVSS